VVNSVRTLNHKHDAPASESNGRAIHSLARRAWRGARSGTSLTFRVTIALLTPPKKISHTEAPKRCNPMCGNLLFIR